MSNPFFLYGRTGWLALNVPLPSAQFDKAASLAWDLTLRIMGSQVRGGLEILESPCEEQVQVPLSLEGSKRWFSGQRFWQTKLTIIQLLLRYFCMSPVIFSPLKNIEKKVHFFTSGTFFFTSESLKEDYIYIYIYINVFFQTAPLIVAIRNSHLIYPDP